MDPNGNPRSRLNIPQQLQAALSLRQTTTYRIGGYRHSFSLNFISIKLYFIAPISLTLSSNPMTSLSRTIDTPMANILARSYSALLYPKKLRELLE